jgi:hypothetical protein
MSEVRAEYGQEIREAKALHDSLSFIHSSLDDAELHPDAFRVYCHILRRAGNDYKAWPSYQSIGDHCFGNLDKAESRRKKAIRAMNVLVDRNFLHKSGMPSKGNHYYIQPPSNWQGGHLISPQGSSHMTNASHLISPKGTPIEGTPMKDIDLGDPMKRMPKQRREVQTALDHSRSAKRIGLTPEQFRIMTDAVLEVCGLTLLVDTSDSPDAVWQHNYAKDAAVFLAQLGYDAHDVVDLGREWVKENDWKGDPVPKPKDLKQFVSKSKATPDSKKERVTIVARGGDLE